jgi:hypothetical protein
MSSRDVFSTMKDALVRFLRADSRPFPLKVWHWVVIAAGLLVLVAIISGVSVAAQASAAEVQATTTPAEDAYFIESVSAPGLYLAAASNGVQTQFGQALVLSATGMPFHITQISGNKYRVQSATDPTLFLSDYSTTTDLGLSVTNADYHQAWNIVGAPAQSTPIFTGLPVYMVLNYLPSLVVYAPDGATEQKGVVVSQFSSTALNCRWRLVKVS